MGGCGNGGRGGEGPVGHGCEHGELRKAARGGGLVGTLARLLARVRLFALHLKAAQLEHLLPRRLAVFAQLLQVAGPKRTKEKKKEEEEKKKRVSPPASVCPVPQGSTVPAYLVPQPTYPIGRFYLGVCLCLCLSLVLCLSGSLSLSTPLCSSVFL